MKKGHPYRVRVTALDEHGQPLGDATPVEFIHRNHDDIPHIVRLMQGTSGLDSDASASLAVGLKLLSETVLQNRNDPLFDVLRAPLRDFIKELKSRRGAQEAP